MRQLKYYLHLILAWNRERFRKSNDLAVAAQQVAGNCHYVMLSLTPNGAVRSALEVRLLGVHADEFHSVPH